MKFVQVVHSRVGRHSLRPHPALLETICATPQNQSAQLLRCRNLWNCQDCCKNDFAWPLLGSNACGGYAAHDITARRTHNQKCFARCKHFDGEWFSEVKLSFSVVHSSPSPVSPQCPLRFFSESSVLNSERPNTEVTENHREPQSGRGASKYIHALHSFQRLAARSRKTLQCMDRESS